MNTARASALRASPLFSPASTRRPVNFNFFQVQAGRGYQQLKYRILSCFPFDKQLLVVEIPNSWTEYKSQQMHEGRDMIGETGHRNSVIQRGVFYVPAGYFNIGQPTARGHGIDLFRFSWLLQPAFYLCDVHI